MDWFTICVLLIAIALLFDDDFNFPSKGHRFAPARA
jgi:hypothetical protein